MRALNGESQASPRFHYPRRMETEAQPDLDLKATDRRVMWRLEPGRQGQRFPKTRSSHSRVRRIDSAPISAGPPDANRRSLLNRQTAQT